MPRGAKHFGPVGRKVLARLEEDFAGVEVDDVAEEDGLVEGARLDLDRRVVGLDQRVGHLLVELDAAEDGAHGAAAADGVAILRLFLVEDALVERELDAVALADLRLDRRVELAEDLFVGLEAEGPQEDRAEELALAVDADVEDVLLVVLELHPGAAVRDDLREERVRRLLREEDAGRAVELARR